MTLCVHCVTFVGYILIYILKSEKVDMLETIAGWWKCGCNFASLLACYSESVRIFSVAIHRSKVDNFRVCSICLTSGNTKPKVANDRLSLSHFSRNSLLNTLLHASFRKNNMAMLLLHASFRKTNTAMLYLTKVSPYMPIYCNSALLG